MVPTEARYSPVEKPRAKRHRLALSCSVCRRRKVKCDRGKPFCKTCQKYHVTHMCVYEEPSWLKEKRRAERSPDRQSVSASNKPSHVEQSWSPGSTSSSTPGTVMSELQSLKGKIQYLEASVKQNQGFSPATRTLPDLRSSSLSSQGLTTPPQHLPPLLPRAFPTTADYKFSLPPLSKYNGLPPRTTTKSLGLTPPAPPATTTAAPIPAVPSFSRALAVPGAAAFAQPRTTQPAADDNRVRLSQLYGIGANDMIDFYNDFCPMVNQMPMNAHGPLAWVTVVLKDKYSAPMVETVMGARNQGCSLVVSTKNAAKSDGAASAAATPDTKKDKLPWDVNNTEPGDAKFADRPLNCPVTGESFDEEEKTSKSTTRLPTILYGESTSYIVEQAIRVLPDRDVAWYLVDRFFKYVYAFAPFLDERDFTADLERITGPRYLAEKRIGDLKLTKKTDLTVVGSFLIVMKFGWRTMSNNYEGPDFPVRSEFEKRILEYPFASDVVPVAELCLQQCKQQRKSTMSLLQFSALILWYYFADTYDGFCPGNDSKLSSGMLIQMGISVGLNRDPAARGFSVFSKRMCNLRRKIWFKLVEVDSAMASQMGNPNVIRDDMYDTKCPTFDPEASNLKDVALEEVAISGIQETVEMIQRSQKVTQMILNMRKKPVVTELVALLEQLESVMRARWTSMAHLMTPTDGNHLHNMEKLHKIVNFCTIVSLLHPVYHYLMMLYEDRYHMQAARKFAKKSILLFMEVMGNFTQLIKFSYRFIGPGFDGILTPMMEMTTHKSLQLYFTLHIRASILQRRFEGLPSLSEEDRRRVELCRKFKDSILEENIEGSYLKGLSVIAGRYFYAWRMRKAHTFLSQALKNGSVLARIKEETANFLMDMTSYELEQFFALLDLGRYAVKPVSDGLRRDSGVSPSFTEMGGPGTAATSGSSGTPGSIGSPGTARTSTSLLATGLKNRNSFRMDAADTPVELPEDDLDKFWAGSFGKDLVNGGEFSLQQIFSELAEFDENTAPYDPVMASGNFDDNWNKL